MKVSVPHRKSVSRLRSKLSAFTLVELLVVIGIIALLISILLPSLAKARESANSVKCQAQIRSLIQAMILHANDHRGYMPLTGYLPHGTQPSQVDDDRMTRYEYFSDTNNGGRLSVLGMPGSLAKYMGFELDTSSYATVDRDLNAGKFGVSMVCPSDHDGGYLSHTVDYVPNCHLSYAINECVLGWGDPGDATGVVTGGTRARGCTAKFTHTSQLALLTDAIPRGLTNGWLLYFNYVGGCTLKDAYNSPISGNGFPGDTGYPAGDGSGKGCGSGTLFDIKRHRGRINIGCADGHVDNVKIAPNDLDRYNLNVDVMMN